MKRPNILIFMTDHQRGDTVLREHPCIKPNLLRFAQQGATFTNAFCPSPHCCPSRATFMTGQYPSRHGVWNNICNDRALSFGPPPEMPFWSDPLGRAGYRMAWSGKWHVSVERTPKDYGWEELKVSGHKRGEHGQSWDFFRQHAQPQGLPRRDGQILRPGYSDYQTYGVREEGNRHDEEAVALGIEALPRLSAGADPWVLYVGCQGPHDPYFVPSRYLDMYRLDDVELPPSYGDSLADKPRIYGKMRRLRFGQLSPTEVRQAIRHFRAYCTYLDELFGRVLQALDRTGQAQDTLVLYVADHGDYCGDHGLFAKGIPCFRGAYHVPAIIRFPAALKTPGRRVSRFVSLADFGPTFNDAALGNSGPDVYGRSLMPFIRNEQPSEWRDDIHTQCNGVEVYYTQRSVMTDRWKYVCNWFDEDELYDLASDPHEMRNLAGSPDHQEVVRQMCRRMWRFAMTQGDASAINYITVSLAPYGPGDALVDDTACTQSRKP